MEAEVNEELPLDSVRQTTETITQPINPLNFIAGDRECEFQDVIDALDPENSPDFDLLRINFRSIAICLRVSRSKSWLLWTRYNIFGTINLYEAYYEVIETWKMVQSNLATLQRLIYALEKFGINYGADTLRFHFGIQPVHVPQIGQFETNPRHHPEGNDDHEDHNPRKYCTNRTKRFLLCVYICIIMIAFAGVSYGLIRCKFS